MFRKLMCAGFCFLLAVSVGGQDGYFQLTKLPWSADWLTEQKDQVVHGEDYRGYPGALPKVYYALGQSFYHPGVDYELLTHVNREAPNWYGNCNGWAAAALIYDEPLSFVANGVKFFNGEAKAMVTTAWKDTVELWSGRVVDGSLTPQSFEEIMNTFIMQDRPIVFDITLGLESWNYPVHGFRRTTRENGDWTEVETEVHFSSTVPLKVADTLEPGEVAPLLKSYFYRKNDQGQYEWIGEDHPHHAWRPTVPYYPESWIMTSNRYIAMPVIGSLRALAQERGEEVDLFEPNDQASSAALLHQNLILASLHENDVDYYRLDHVLIPQNEIRIEVYDGPTLDIRLRDGSGQTLMRHEDVSELAFAIPNSGDGIIYLTVEQSLQNQDENWTSSFYKIERDDATSWVDLPLVDESYNLQVHIFNRGESDGSLFDGALSPLPVGASKALTLDETAVAAISDADAIWGMAFDGGDVVSGSYVKGKPSKMPYILPHVSFVNGWDTTLNVIASKPSVPIYADLFDADGDLIITKQLSSLVLKGERSLGSLIGAGKAYAVHWAQLRTAADNYLYGYARFENDEKGFYTIDIQSQPRNGRLEIVNLFAKDSGFTGLSLVNTAGRRNEILFELRGKNGRLVADGIRYLEDGEKWIGSIDEFVGAEVNPEDDLVLMSQFNLHGMVLRQDNERQRRYIEPLLSPVLDQLEETYIFVPAQGLAGYEMLVNNSNAGTSYIWAHGYDASGNLLDSQVISPGGPMQSRSAFVTDMLQILARFSGEVADEIRWFRISSQRPVYINQYLGMPDNETRHFVRLPKYYTKP